VFIEMSGNKVSVKSTFNLQGIVGEIGYKGDIGHPGLTGSIGSHGPVGEIGAMKFYSLYD
jgi:hypothetical protein